MRATQQTRVGLAAPLIVRGKWEGGMLCAVLLTLRPDMFQVAGEIERRPFCAVLIFPGLELWWPRCNVV